MSRAKAPPPPVAPGPPHPRQSTTLIGHDAAQATLLTAFQSGRLPHAWLITGPEGVGKASLAYRFARFLLTQPGPGGGDALFAPAPPHDLHVAPHDPAAREIAAGAHPDLRSIERELNDKTGKMRRDIAVDQIRDLIDFMHLTPSKGGWRVAIIDPADDLGSNAANALLKTLEEPPPRACLILVSHAPGGLLPTIRSRCRRLDLRKLPLADLDQVVAGLLPDLPGADRPALLALAEGSPGRAVALSAGGGLGIIRDLVALLATLPNTPIDRLHAFTDPFVKATGDTAYHLLIDLFLWWLGRLIQALARGDALPETVPGERAAAKILADRLGLERLLEALERIQSIFAAAERLNLDRRQAILNAVFALGAGRSG